MKQLIKKLAIVLSVALVCAPMGAMAANKLIVKDATGTIDKMVVTDGGRIGLGTSAPISGINVQSNNGTDGSLKFQVTTATTGDAAGIYLLRNNPTGTNSLPLNGNRLAILTFGSMDGATQRASAGIFAYASGGDWSSTSTPSVFSFETTPVGSTARAEGLRISNQQFVGIAQPNPTQRLDVNGGIRLNTLTAKPATCDINTRGVIWYTRSAVGVADKLEVCAKDSADLYAWKALF